MEHASEHGHDGFECKNLLPRDYFDKDIENLDRMAEVIGALISICGWTIESPCLIALIITNWL